MSISMEFDLSRVRALEAYNRMEKRLCDLMRALIGCDPSVGRLIFFSVSNVHPRLAILRGLFKQPSYAPYEPSWRQIEKWLRDCAEVRNKIVHWTVEQATELPDYASIGPDELYLAIPQDYQILWNARNSFVNDDRGAGLTLAEMSEFQEKVTAVDDILRLLFFVCFFETLSGALLETSERFKAGLSPVVAEALAYLKQ